MELKNKLKELRVAHNMTQETVAEHLGVSSQTVSKWERGLLCPDINLLPKIALLFKCSIDFLFDMELAWGLEHRQEFEAEIRELHSKKDWEGVYRAWIREIELNPDTYKNYSDVMLHVYRKKLYDKDHVEKMLSLADHAEKCCTNDDTRNEIYRVMLQICSESGDKTIKEKGKYYYNKLPLLRHSREVYSKLILEDEEYRNQLLKNIIYLTDLTECSVRQLITSDMPQEERLFYYQKAAKLYETVLDGKYGGFYDSPLLFNYCEIAVIYAKLGKLDMASEYIKRIFEVLKRHMTDFPEEKKSVLLYSSSLRNAPSGEELCKKILQNMMKIPELEQFRGDISEMKNKYEIYMAQKEERK